MKGDGILERTCYVLTNQTNHIVLVTPSFSEIVRLSEGQVDEAKGGLAVSAWFNCACFLLGAKDEGEPWDWHCIEVRGHPWADLLLSMALDEAEL